MKAIRVRAFGEPDVMRVEELPAPRPVTGQILVEIKAAGVNPVDTYMRSANTLACPIWPYTPGVDGAAW